MTYVDKNGETRYCYGRIWAHKPQGTQWDFTADMGFLGIGAPWWTDAEWRSYCKNAEAIYYWEGAGWRRHPSGEPYQEPVYPWSDAE